MKREIMLSLMLIVFPTLIYAGWWNQDYAWKYPLNDLRINSDMNAGSIIRLEQVDFSALNILCDDLNDFRVVDEPAQLELDRVVQGNASTTNGSVEFEIKKALAAGTYNGRFYIYVGNPSCPEPEDDVLEEGKNKGRARIKFFQDIRHHYITRSKP